MMSIAVEPEPVPLAMDEHGTFRVSGTRVTLETLIAAFDRGDTPEEIHEQYPSVALGDINAVLTYSVRHRATVQDYLGEREHAGARVRARVEDAFPPDGLRARLLARGSASDDRDRRRRELQPQDRRTPLREACRVAATTSREGRPACRSTPAGASGSQRTQPPACARRAPAGRARRPALPAMAEGSEAWRRRSREGRHPGRALRHPIAVDTDEGSWR